MNANQSIAILGATGGLGRALSRRLAAVWGIDGGLASIKLRPVTKLGSTTPGKRSGAPAAREDSTAR